MTFQEKTGTRRERVRQRILDTALDLYANEGGEGLSMRRLAGEAGFSVAALYKYYVNKNEILADIRECFYEQLYNNICEVIARGGTAEERLRQGCIAYVNTGLSDPDLYATCFNIPLARRNAEPPDLTDLNTFRAQAFLAMHGTVEELTRSGKIAGEDSWETAYCVWSAVHGLTAIMIFLPVFPGINRQEIVGRYVDILIGGLKSGVKAPLSLVR
jgi:AcrR family transcriptional regulator